MPQLYNVFDVFGITEFNKPNYIINKISISNTKINIILRIFLCNVSNYLNNKIKS